MPSAAPSYRPRSRAAPRDVGRLVARALCLVFALVGLLPPLAAALLRSEPVRDWAANETMRLLDEKLGLRTHFRVRLSLWPLALELRDVTLESSDRGEPVLVAPRMSVRPRLFSLLSGRADAGQISIEEPRLRVVIKDGALANLKLDLPEGGEGPTTYPNVSVAITDARVSADIEGVQVESPAIDLDLFSDGPDTLEVALRAATTHLVRERPKPGATAALDEDVVCQLDARVRLAPRELLVRRLSLLGVLDASDDANTAPECDLETVRNDPRRVLMRLSGLRVQLDAGAPHQVGGHVLLQAPLEVAARFGPSPELSGWVQVNGELDVTDRTQLPEFHGRLRTGRIGLKKYVLAAHSDAELHLVKDKLTVTSFSAGYADGDVQLEDVSIDLLAPGVPLVVRRAVATNLTFPGLMRDVDVTEQTIVNWDLNRVLIDDFKGTLDPPAMNGKLSAETRNFEVYDRSVHDPKKKHMIGVPRARLSGIFGVHGDSVRFDDMRADFGKSLLRTSVHIGFDNTIQLVVPEGSALELADVSPLIDIPIAGHTALNVTMNGKMSDPVLTGKLGIDDLWFAGFPLGNLKTESLRFVPLVVQVADGTLSKGGSEWRLSNASIDFDANATVRAEASVQSKRMDLRDFFAMWHFDEDPRWDSISGKGGFDGRVSYVLGGKDDRCQAGNLDVRGNMSLSTLAMFDERYSDGKGSFHFNWFDPEGSYLGMQVDVPRLTLRKGSGTLLGSLRVMPGARVSGDMIATHIPLSEVQGLGPLAQRAVGSVSAEASVSGSLDALAAQVQARISPVHIGRSELPSSSVSVRLEPIERPLHAIGKSACGAPKTGGFDRAEFLADRPGGVFHTTGSLFGGQIMLDDFQITRQSAKHVRGRVDFHSLDLVAISNLSPALAALDPQPTGTLDATLALQDLALAAPLNATGTLDLMGLSLTYGNTRIEAPEPTRLELASGRLEVPKLALHARTETGQSAVFDLRGKLERLGEQPSADLRFTLQPTSLDGFVGLIPGAERATGKIGGQIAVTGALSAPVYRGGLELTNGAIYMRNSPYSITELDLKLGIVPGELIIENGEFSAGGGRVQFQGNAPLIGFRLGEVRTFITARDISLPLVQGVRATADADLRARWQPGGAPAALGKQTLPQLVGNVTLTSFAYSRPVKMSANITDLAQRGRRTEFDSYQPEGDVVSFDLNVRATKPLVLSNNLIDARLTIEDDVLQLAGTNQRFGVRGALRLVPGGRVRLTRNEFEIQQGRVRFDDPTRIAPLVDVTAVTEFRRYGGSIDASSAATASTLPSTAGEWKVAMHAHGDAETLRIDLSSQPQLSQDDIFLLLTLGVTRAELDQVQSSALGESVALQALGALTGADQVVTEAIPVIDEFRLGSLSSRTGRTEPAVTIGKRLSERIRAFVTSGLSESRDVRSNVEVKINRKVSIEGSYDNVNDISSSTLGNLGADIRWRLEFQ
ncbi:MAG TPA: translocation/assembly module TamB domain-containing protein [Polyangiaceae bacterium]|nr:translocation/assembly module TamB domain-containing protein [Polyangiaceae bacterium]